MLALPCPPALPAVSAGGEGRSVRAGEGRGARNARVTDPQLLGRGLTSTGLSVTSRAQSGVVMAGGAQMLLPPLRPGAGGAHLGATRAVHIRHAQSVLEEEDLMEEGGEGALVRRTRSCVHPCGCAPCRPALPTLAPTTTLPTIPCRLLWVKCLLGAACMHSLHRRPARCGLLAGRPAECLLERSRIFMPL
jgi:hypothetical protein